MYFVDRKKIELMLQCLEEVTTIFTNEKQYKTSIEKLALERIVLLMIDSILDVGNSMIDGFIMRDPGSYEDIIDILMDEKVVLEEQGKQLKEIIKLRKILMQDYMNMDHEHVESVVNANIQAIQAYPSRIRNYLEKELGPVSAFSNS
ncbi:DUF86 domain-containing protein [Ectobacillus polymachus]|uniref:DUF86 domain-containing protein n=1 Tax=Ectobacillus polymachus TaxID=1508806 RepID=UPI003A8BC46A